MRLKKLLVAGFKSFVDSTDIRLPSHLVGVVGPNGCGKSNVIDAVRWVMGESSAKMLRGDSMADVIFNGSGTRKPVGKASVELIFDNSRGKAPGNYGQFAEISIRRTMTRDGISTYSINKIKTRRKDVLDLFRGTGLGPRSYSIIEQGMVSRIIEAKPEDLRVFVEEAAGTSKYKDRRRETESRIAHTRENLDRVADIRDELAKQLRRLKRQSAAARRYKVLKKEERMVSGQLQVLRLKGLDGQLEKQERITARYENELQSVLASKRQSESKLESLREQQSEANDLSSGIQQEFYRIGAEISNLEQRIEHRQEAQLQKSKAIEELEKNKITLRQQLESDNQKEVSLHQALATMAPEIASLLAKNSDAETQLHDAERILQDWLLEMEAFTEEAREPAQQVEVQKSRIEYLQEHISRAGLRREKVNNQITDLKQQTDAIDIEVLRREVDSHNRQYEKSEQIYNETETEIKTTAIELEQKRALAANERNQLQEVVSRYNSLAEIQNATLGGDNDGFDEWLESMGLDTAPKLAEKIMVEAGWQAVADRVLNGYLGAISAQDISAEMFRENPDCSFAVIADSDIASKASRLPLPELGDKIKSDSINIASLLSEFYIAESLEQALAEQHNLVGRECIVTREGALIGANWISFASQNQLETGVLVREGEMEQLELKRQQLSKQVEVIDDDITGLNDTRADLENNLEIQKKTLNNLRLGMADLHNRFGREEAQYLEAREQITKLASELEDLSAQINGDENEIENAEVLLSTSAEQTGNFDIKREGLIRRRDELNRQVADRRAELSEIKENHYQKSLKLQQLESDLQSVKQTIKRLNMEIENSKGTLQELENNTESPEQSLETLKIQLDTLLEQKLAVDKKFASTQDLMTEYDNKISHANTIKTEQENRVNNARESLEQQKLARQDILVRRDTHSESIIEQGFLIQECEVELPEDATIEQWQESLEGIERKIAQIGPVNLVAIEEFDEESERMEYLDNQHADLSEALDILESVIRKIDRETRSRFKSTFDQINAGFNQFFPKLFGGGKAELLLTSDDLLTTGISVMARPPGKRNSHIHLLSGGEKALTAVALLFSLFELNPAPFCMLDEVDAPLDDANVDRYCRTLKTLAKKSQMIVITHNKITMEAMNLLVGVTMAEAGVSRLVSVDIDQAVEMAAQ